MSSGPKRTPSDTDHINVTWVVAETPWPFPTWIERKLYDREFGQKDLATTGQRIQDALQAISVALDKRFAGEDTGGDRVGDSVRFRYWRKLDPKDRKEKPIDLKASMFQHPEYERAWVLIEDI